jgi:hypothetical protein
MSCNDALIGDTDHGHRFITLFVFAAGMADKPVAIRDAVNTSL